MLTMSPFCSLRCDGRGLPNTIAGLAIGVVPMMRKSVAAAVEDGGAGGAQFVFRHARQRVRRSARARALAQHTDLAHAAKLFLVDHDRLVQEAFEDGSASGRDLAHVVLVDQEVVVVTRRSRPGRCVRARA
jgi:hypothetical protein